MTPSKRKKSPPMVMKPEDIDVRLRLLERWDYVCIVCGHGFENLACVTKEHIVPKSAPRHMKPEENLAPSHHVCNKLRQTDSILIASQRVEAIRAKMKPAKFLHWLASPVPHRIVPPKASAPLRQRQFMELPDHLPGMP